MLLCTCGEKKIWLKIKKYQNIMTRTLVLSSVLRLDKTLEIGFIVFLQESKAMIQRSFEVCGITTTNQGLISKDNFLKRIMANVEVTIDQADDDDMFKDLFEN